MGGDDREEHRRADAMIGAAGDRVAITELPLPASFALH
jgi:hypothetical protein